MQMKESHAWLVLPPAGKDVSVEWMQLILLQVPGFKELQALLHRQAFLQTLVETEEEAAVRCWCSSNSGRRQEVQARDPEISGHARADGPETIP